MLDWDVQSEEPVESGGGAPAPTPSSPGHLMGFDTPLTTTEEPQFQAWKQQYAPKDSGYDYDLRGAFKAGLKPDPVTGHWPDTYKKPNHPTFSDQSQYAKVRPDLAGRWQGDIYVPPTKAVPAAPAADPWAVTHEGPAMAAAPTGANEWAVAAETPAAEHPGFVSALGQGLFRGAVEAGRDMTAQTFVDRPKAPPDTTAIGKLLQTPVTEGWSDPSWWAANMAHGAGSSWPALTMGTIGTVIGGGPETPTGWLGGAAGFGIGSAAQELAPSYQRAREAGLSHDQAVDRAMEQSGIAGIMGTAMGVAPGISLLGRDAYGALKRPISEALLQVFGAQPAIGTLGAELQAETEGRHLTPEEAATSYVTQAGVGAAFVGGHRLIERAAGAARRPGTTGAVPGAGEAGAAAGEAPEPEMPPPPPPPPTGSTIGIRMPGGAPPRRAQVVGTFDDGKYTTIRHEDGSHQDVRTDELHRDITEPPPRAEEVASVPPEEGEAAVSEAERFEVEPAYVGPKKRPARPAELGREAIAALDQADGLERSALDMTNSLSTETRQDMLTQSARLRRMHATPTEPAPSTPEAAAATAERRRLAGLGKLGQAAAAAPERYAGPEYRPPAPPEGFDEALADVQTARSTMPREQSLFGAIRDMGGIKLTGPDGTRTKEGQDVAAALQDVRYPGLINNRAGVPPDDVRGYLREHGWFGGREDRGADIADLSDLLSQEAGGTKVYHPESDIGLDLRYRSDLERQLDEAGVTLRDSPVSAAKKLATWRGEQLKVARGASEGETPVVEKRAPPSPEGRPIQGTREAPIPVQSPQDIAVAETRVEPQPTEGQKQAGNYAKGHISFQGLPVSIETPKGAIRQGPKNTAGVPAWESVSPAAYGYIKGTESKDGEPVDIYIGPHVDSPDAFIVDQIDPATGKFDELKAIAGVRDEDEAKALYDAAFPDGSGPSHRGAITALPVENLLEWVNTPPKDRSVGFNKPLAYQEHLRASVPLHHLDLHDLGVATEERRGTQSAATRGNVAFDAAAKRARELGVPFTDKFTAEDIWANIHEREAIMATEAEADRTADALQNQVVTEVAIKHPEVLDDIPFGDELRGQVTPIPSAAGRVGEGRNEPEEPARKTALAAGAGEVAEGSRELEAEGAEAPPEGGQRPVDANKNPIFKDGERVVIPEGGQHAGRHGVVVRSTGIVMQNLFGGTKSEASYHYTVKTDGGAETMASKLEPEIGPAPKAVPDPVYKGHATDPESLERGIGYSKRNAKSAKEVAGRARKRDRVQTLERAAAQHEKDAAEQQSILDSWRTKHGKAVAQEKLSATPPVAQVGISATPVVPVPPVPGVDVRENADRDGVEVRFKGRPDDATLGRLKAAGFKWSKPQRLWYAKRSPERLALANSLKGGGQSPIGAPTGPSAADDTIQRTPPAATPASPSMDVTAFRRAIERAGAAQMNGLWRIVPDVGSGYAVEHTPPNGRRDTLRAPQSEDPWSLDRARDAAVEAAFGPRVPTEPDKTGQVGTLSVSAAPTYVEKREGEAKWKPIGTNARGNPIFEDQRGVRSYTDRGARFTEPVAIEPSKAGVKLRVDRPAPAEYEPVTPSEVADQQAAEQGARAEVDASEYQPANMPITSAVPPDPPVSGFRRGDQIDVRPEHRQLIGRPINRIVTDVSPDGQFLTLDGGLKIEASWVAPAGEPINYPPGLIQAPEAPTVSTQQQADVSKTPVQEQRAAATPQEGTGGFQVEVRPGTPRQGPSAVQGTGAQPSDRPVPATEVGGGARAPGAASGPGAEGAGRPTEGPPSTPFGGGESVRPDDGVRGPRKPPEPRAPGRPADADVTGTNYQIQSGEVAEGRGPKAKALDNLAAIELVKKLQGEGRPATRDEQGVLAKYVGWGGLSGAFRNNQGKFGAGFEDVGKRLEALLTPGEHATASKSTQYAHYTAEHVIRSMWDAVERMGFRGGQVFEPGMGIGHFLGMMAPDVAARSEYQGIEMDHLTADIAKLLYPESGVRQADFTQTPIPEGTFDLVIGNPPFSDTIIKADPKYAARNFMLHDYFFAKSMDSLRPGGLLAFVTSAGTMNKTSPFARDYLARQAEFLGGVRMPSTAFKKNAGTEVTADILFFKKRDEPLDSDEALKETWTDTVNRDLPDNEGNMGKVAVSRYFTDHPEMVLGQEGRFDKLYKGRYAVHAPEGADLPQALADALEKLPKDIYEAPLTPVEKAEADFDAPETKDGSFYLQNGRLMQYDGGVGRPVARRGAGQAGGLTKDDHERIVHLVPIRDALRDVYRADLAQNTEDGAVARERLNAAYDIFTKKFGPINKAEFRYQHPSIVQQEAARAEAREEARDRGESWEEGDFNSVAMTESGATLAEIARARAEARRRQNETGTRGFDEGSFNPEEIPDAVIEKRPNVHAFMDDPESYRLRAIEDYNDQTGAAKKKRVFYESVLTRETEPDIKSAGDGVLWSLNKFGRLDLDAVAAKRKQSRDDLIGELGDSIFQVPGASNTYQTADEYLSGDVVDKLATAKKFAETDSTMARNVAALEAALPAPLPPSEITMTLGMPWIPSTTVNEFASQHLGISDDVYTRRSDVLGGWTVTVGSHGANYARWSTEDMNAGRILQEALNRTKPRIYRKTRDGSEFDPVATQAVSDKIDEMQAEFGNWLESDPDRTDKMAGIYNDTLNRTVLRKHDGSYLTTPGISSEWKWRPHQQRAVARIIQSGNTYVAHAVGAGKTSVYIGAGMEMRRLGLVKKPMYVVPNHMLAQFTKEFYEQYPTARIAVADERRFHTSRRKQFIANVAQDDLDAVIITHSAYGMIPLSQKFQNELINEEIEKIEEALSGLDKHNDRVTVKKLENRKEKLEQRMKGAFSGRKDKTNTFEEMGVDFQFIDEAHEFRKLDFASRQNIKGIDGEGSNKSFDLYSKGHYLESKNPGRSQVMGSGTPVTNTMGELYTLSRYMQPQALEARGISHFDSWSAAFGDVKTETEPTAQGTYERVTRFSRFVNAHELYKMVGEVMDIVTPAQLDQYVVRPKLQGGKRQMHLAPKTDQFERYQQSLVRRVEAIKARKGPPAKGDDILLSVINDGRHAAIDLRLVEAAQNDPDSKLNQMLTNVFDIWRQSKDTRFFDPGTRYQTEIARGPATQMIFSNLGVNPRGPGGFGSYKWMKQRLLQLGIPKDQIAFIGDSKTHVARQKLFNDMNSGKVRVLIGSTQKMGTGVNAQRRLLAIHNLDPLWYPSDDEQRVGRGLRQGNWNPEIGIHDYATKGTYDEQMWGMMGRKARFIEQFFRGDPTLRTMEDVGEASFYEQASAIAASDERVIRLTELKHDLQKIERQSAAHDREQFAMRQKIKYAQGNVEEADKAVPALQTDIAQRVPTRGDKFVMRIGDGEFIKRAEAADALGKIIETRVPTLEAGERVVIGELGGFPILLGARGKGNYDLYWRRANRQLAELRTMAETPSGMIRALEETFAGLEDRVRYWDRQKAEAEKEIASLTPEIGKPFAKRDEIGKLRREVSKLEKAIRPPVPLNTVADVDKAIKENAEDYHKGDIDHDEFDRKAKALHARREELQPPPAAEGDVKFQVPRAPAPVFFSGIERAIETGRTNRATPDQWKGTIKNLPGIKAEERDWLGIDQWLDDQKGPVTKDQLLGFIRANNVQIKEVMKGRVGAGEAMAPGVLAEQRHEELDAKRATQPLSPREQSLFDWLDENQDASDLEYLTREYDLWREENKMPQMSADALYSELSDLRDSGKRTGPEVDAQIIWLRNHIRDADAASDAAEAGGPEDSGGTRFASYTLPGGENYRELLLTLPRADGGYNFQEKDGAVEIWDGLNLARRMPNMDAARAWANTEGARRALTRTFHSGHFDEPNILAHVRFNDRTDADGKKTLFVEEIQSDWHQQGRRKGYEGQTPRYMVRLGDDVIGRYHAEAEARIAVHEAGPRASLSLLPKSGVPDAPFKTTWPELAFKRILRFASENGYDQLAWTTGDQQNERYDLSKHLSELKLEDNVTGGVSEASLEGEFTGGHLTAWDTGPNRPGGQRRIAIDRRVNDLQELVDIVGKDAADKLMESKPVRSRSGGLGVRVRSLSGLELKVGGEGMKGFYDKMLPALANKIGKKWGAKVGTTKISAVRKDAMGRPSSEGGRETVHSLPITDAMRESVMGGQPLFERGKPFGKRAIAPGLTAMRQPLESIPLGKMSPGEQKLVRQVQTELARIAPGANAKIVRGLRAGNDQVFGVSYRGGLRGLVSVALESPDMVGTARHEAVHFMKGAGLFTDPEWKSLEDAAKSQGWLAKHDIAARYPDMDHATRLEEAIAEEFGAYRRSPQSAPSGPVKAIFKRMADFLKNVAGAVRRIFGKVSADEVFRSMDAGEVGRRGALEEGDGSSAINFQRPKSPDEAPEPPPEGRDYYDNIADAMAENARGQGQSPGTFARSLSQRAYDPALGRTKRLGWVARHFTEPRSLARMDHRSAKFWNAIKAADHEASGAINSYRDLARPYLELSAPARAKVDAVLELDRLSNNAREDDGRTVIARNTAFQDAELSKPGDMIELAPEESTGLHAVRSMFKKQWRDIIGATAKKMGWEGDPSSAGIRAHVASGAFTGGAGEKRSLLRTADLLEGLEAQERVGYVPLMRYGDYYVAVRYKPGEEPESLGGFPTVARFELVESSPGWEQMFGEVPILSAREHSGGIPSAARARLAELHRRYPSDTYEIEHGYLTKSADKLRTLDIPGIEKFLMAIQQKDSALYEPLVEAARQQMYEEMKAGFKRRSRTVPGYSADIGRGIGSYSFWVAHHTADLLHRDNIDRAYQGVEQHPSKNVRDFWSNWKRDDEKGVTVGDRFARGLNAAAFYYVMAGNPSSAIVTFDAPLVARAVLSTGIGGGRVRAPFLAAMGDGLRSMRANTKEGIHVDILNMGKNAAERTFLAGMLANGELGRQRELAADFGALADQQSQAFGEYQSRAKRALDISASAFMASNELSRAVTALTAYRLARDPSTASKMAKAWERNEVFRDMVRREGLSPTTLARFLTTEAAFEWGKQNRSEASRAPAGQIFFLFKQFPLRFISVIKNLMIGMGPAGKASAALLLASLWMFAGMQGLPFVQDVEKFYDWLNEQLRGEDPQVKAAMYRGLDNAGLGKLGADATMRGPVSVMLGADVSNRYGFGDLIGQTMTGVDFLGAAPSMFFQAIAGANRRAASGQSWQAVAAQAAPAAIRNPLQAFGVYPNEGIKTQAGTTMVPPKDIGAADIASRAAGFQPLKASRAYDRAEFERRTAAAQNVRVTRAYATLANFIEDQQAALKSGDKARAALYGKAIGDFMKANADLRLNLSTAIQQVRRRAQPSQEAIRRAPLRARGQMLDNPFPVP